MTQPDYGVDTCIECGAMSDCLLPERFPHICHACLFPPRLVNPGAQAADEGTRLSPARHTKPHRLTLIEALEARVGMVPEVTEAKYADRTGRNTDDDAA
jgi:hypothetical protein